MSQMIDEYHTVNGITKLEAAERIGINYPTYKRKTNEHDDYEITVTEIVPFIRAHNMDFRLLDRIEERLGRVAFSVPKTGEEISTDQVADMIENLVSYIAEMARIISDGVIDDQEKKRLNTLSIKLTQQSTGFHAAVDNK